MHFFFMPNVPGVESHLTLTNFATMDRNLADDPLQTQYVHVTWADGKRWQHRCIDVLETGKSRIYGRDSLPADYPGETSPFFYCHPERQAQETERQVSGDHQHTLSGWRGNIQLASSQMGVSYQGEFPGDMVKIPKGSFVSVNPMLQQLESVRNKLIFVNICADPAVKNHPIILAKASSAEKVSVQQVQSNNCSVVDLDVFDAGEEDLMVVACGSLVGVPVYLSHTDDFSEMSLEHTHPPVSSVLFGDGIRFQRHMKSYWLSKLFG